MKTKYPSVKTLTALFVSLKADIGDDYRCSDDAFDTTPGMTVTIGFTAETGAWDYQTGDNSYTGGAYSHKDWAVVSLYRRSNSRELAHEVIEQLAEQVAI